MGISLAKVKDAAALAQDYMAPHNLNEYNRDQGCERLS